MYFAMKHSYFNGIGYFSGCSLLNNFNKVGNIQAAILQFGFCF